MMIVNITNENITNENIVRILPFNEEGKSLEELKEIIDGIRHIRKISLL